MVLGWVFRQDPAFSNTSGGKRQVDRRDDKEKSQLKNIVSTCKSWVCQTLVLVELIIEVLEE